MPEFMLLFIENAVAFEQQSAAPRLITLVASTELDAVRQARELMPINRTSLSRARLVGADGSDVVPAWPTKGLERNEPTVRSAATELKNTRF